MGVSVKTFLAVASMTDEPSTVRSKFKLRWYQFSLRGLLIFTTLLCIALSWHMTGVSRQREAIDAITAAGGKYWYSYFYDDADSYPPKPREGFVVWLAAILGDDHCYDVTVVDLAGAKVDDSLMGKVCRLPCLRGLELDDSDVGDKNLQYLAGCKSLEYLNLKRTKITDAGLAHIRQLTGMKWLTLSETAITDDGLGCLLGLTSLEELSLDATRITDRGLHYLAAVPKSCRVRVGDTQVTQQGVSDSGRRAETGYYQGFPCSGRNLPGDPKEPVTRLLDQLAVESKAKDAFAKLIAPFADIPEWSQWDPSGVSYVQTDIGRIAIVRVDSHRWGWGGLTTPPKQDGCVDFPDHWGSQFPESQFLCLGSDGKPLWSIEAKERSACIADADGDGKYEELIRWAIESKDVELLGKGLPFLVVHDLTKPGMPAMLAIIINDRIAREQVRVSMRADTAGRSAIVLEEQEEGEYHVRTTFRFDPASRIWNTDATELHPCWRRLRNPRYRLPYCDSFHACEFACLGTELKGDATQPETQLLDDLAVKDKAVAAVERLLGPDQFQYVAIHLGSKSSFDSSGVCYFQQDSDRRAVVRLNVKYPGIDMEDEPRVSCPGRLESEMLGDVWICLGSDGKWLWRYFGRAVVLDADGDGKAEELLCWSVVDDQPVPGSFFSIFDLSRPNLPTMASIAFPANEFMEVDPNDDEAAKPRLTALLTQNPFEPKHLRGPVRWSMPRNKVTDANDLVIEELKEDQYVVRAVFTFDRELRRWTTDAIPEPHPCWQPTRDPYECIEFDE